MGSNGVMGQNGTFAYAELLRRAAYTCAECGLHDDICVCEQGPARIELHVYDAAERYEQDRRMTMLGWAIIAAVAFAFGYLFGAAL